MHTRRALAQAIKDAQLKYPELSADGIRVAVRGAPFQPIVLDQVATAIEALSMLESTKTGRVGSYRLKHVAEAWGRHHELCAYVSNGALIVAALALDLAVEPCGPPWRGSPNVMIGVAEKSTRRMIAGNAFADREQGLKETGNRATV